MKNNNKLLTLEGLKILITTISILLLISPKGFGQIVICGKAENDIVKVLKENEFSFKLYVEPSKAVHAAKKGSGILFLAKDYPIPTKIPDSIFLIAKRKHLKLFIEYPANLPNQKVKDSIIYNHLNRLIVTKSKIKELDSLSLLDMNNNGVIALNSVSPLIVYGKVAGFDKAEYGISDIKSYPLLFQDENIMVSTARISSCITGRFGPADSWKRVWLFILKWLNPEKKWNFKSWPEQVIPSYLPNERLSENSFKTSIEKGSLWFYNAKLLVDSSWENLFLQRTAKNGIGVVYPKVDETKAVGNGMFGILEGQASIINDDGSQPYRWWIRSDCQAETAQALALSSNYLNLPNFKITASNLLDYVFLKSNLRGGPRDNKNSPTYGLIGWATTDPDAYYGDDNARVILGTIGASAAIGTDKWDSYFIQGILGNFRTAGKLGFRGNWFRDSTIQKIGWLTLSDRDNVNIHPHYESWLWACYLWLYDKTGYTPLLEKAKSAIAITMKNYPDRWKWTNGIQQERARMILPLAWLIRIEDTPEHRQWLKAITDALLKNLQSCGAIREELGISKNGKYGRILSNAEYGLREAPLISKNGDPVSDLLYTMNFAFFALNEAASATGDANYIDAVRRISEFLVRIQIKSEKHPDLDGAWFRAFNYKLWNFWASNADEGWGPWCTETGWIQSWIVSTLILVQKKSCFWQETKNINIKQKAIQEINLMLK